MDNISIASLFDLSHSVASDYLSGFKYPWKALAGLSDFILSLGESLPESEYEEREKGIWVHRSARVVATAVLIAPVIIGPGSFVGHSAFVRNGVIVGADCSIGTSVEIRNSILFDNVEIAHFNYVGDSIIGYHSHFGAGAIVSNVKSDYSNIVVRGEDDFETGVWKLGAMVGDHVEVGCNAVLNPGTVIGRNTTVYPCSNVRGVIPPSSIVKSAGVTVVPKR